MSVSGHENQKFYSKKSVEMTRAANVAGFGLIMLGAEV
jgi:hypothetical protein